VVGGSAYDEQRPRHRTPWSRCPPVGKALTQSAPASWTDGGRA